MDQGVVSSLPNQVLIIYSCSQMLHFHGLFVPESTSPFHTLSELRGRKREAPFSLFTMETALYPKNCKCSAAVSLPPPPQLELTSHPTSRFSPQQVPTNPSHTDPESEARLLSIFSLPNQPSEPPRTAHKSPLSLPFLLSVLPIFQLFGLCFSLQPRREPGRSPAAASQLTH